MRFHRLAAFCLCGVLAASWAQADPVNHQALDDRSKAAVAASCRNWVVEERPELVAFWMDQIKPLCEAGASTQTGAPATPQ